MKSWCGCFCRVLSVKTAERGPTVIYSDRHMNIHGSLDCYVFSSIVVCFTYYENPKYFMALKIVIKDMDTINFYIVLELRLSTVTNAIWWESFFRDIE